jgi:hypothetical protein
LGILTLYTGNAWPDCRANQEDTMDNYHVTQAGDHWELKKEGASRASRSAPTKEALLKETSAFLEGKTASVKIHKGDGSIQEERTYPRSADPRKSEG